MVFLITLQNANIVLSKSLLEFMQFSFLTSIYIVLNRFYAVVSCVGRPVKDFTEVTQIVDRLYSEFCKCAFV